MALHFHTPRASRWPRMRLPAGHERFHGPIVAVLAIAALALLASTLQVVAPAIAHLSRPLPLPVRQALTSLNVEDVDSDATAADREADLIELPSATVDAINL